MNPSPISAGSHQPRLAERAQMVRHERLAECCRVHQLGDGSLARGEYLEEAQARFVAKCAESERGHGASVIGDVRHGQI